MSNIHIPRHQLVLFHDAKVDYKTAHKYEQEMKNARTPYLVVEERKDHKFNVIAGFKYINGLHFLQSKIDLYCTVIPPIKSEKERKLAMLQRTLAANSDPKVYKEILVHDLVTRYQMNESSIGNNIGVEPSKIKKYMYKQVIPNTFYQDAKKAGILPLVQTIFMTNHLSSTEKRILTDLSIKGIFRNKHIDLFKAYRKHYPLFEDYNLAKQQVLSVINIQQPIQEYWSTIPHPLKYFNDDDYYNFFEFH